MSHAAFSKCWGELWGSTSPCSLQGEAGPTQVLRCSSILQKLCPTASLDILLLGPYLLHPSAYSTSSNFSAGERSQLMATGVCLCRRLTWVPGAAEQRNFLQAGRAPRSTEVSHLLEMKCSFGGVQRWGSCCFWGYTERVWCCSVHHC